MYGYLPPFYPIPYPSPIPDITISSVYGEQLTQLQMNGQLAFYVNKLATEFNKFQIKFGSLNQRPTNAENGMQFFDTNSKKLLTFYANVWYDGLGNIIP